MKYFSTLIKPTSSHCNMKCEYCFYEDVSSYRSVGKRGLMSVQTAGQLIKSTLEAFDKEVTITFSFQGGEPTLAGLPFFEKFVCMVNEQKQEFHHVNYTLQTNGLLLDDAWVAFFRKNRVLVGVSLDGFARNHDAVRKDKMKNGTFSRVMHSIQKLKQAEVEFNILTVLTSELSHCAKELFEFYLENGLKYLQLIPCLPSLDGTEQAHALKPEEFFAFYDEFYRLWYQEWKKGNVISVTYFDNLIPLFAGRLPQQCGYLGFCTHQFVIESDASVYPCDFYALDPYYCGNLWKQTIRELALSPSAKAFLTEKRTRSGLCTDCRYENICRGQCKRMSVCYYRSEYCGLRQFMSKHEKTLMEVAATIREK